MTACFIYTVLTFPKIQARNKDREDSIWEGLGRNFAIKDPKDCEVN